MRLRTAYFIIAAACLPAAVSCEKNPAAKPDAVEVVLYADIYEYTPTRAPINSWDNTPINVAYSTDAGNTKNFSMVLDGYVSGFKTYFYPLFFYPTEGYTIYLMGYYPRAALGSDNKVAYNIASGQYDLMVSTMVSGSQSVPINSQGNRSITFSHLLSQIVFNMRSNPDFPYPNIIKVTDIEIRGVALNVTLDLNTSDIAVSGVTGSVTAYHNASGYLLTTSFANAPISSPVMIQAEQPFEVWVHFDNGTSTRVSNLNVAATGATKGYAYNVELTFSSPASIIGKATPVLWTDAWDENTPPVEFPANMW